MGTRTAIFKEVGADEFIGIYVQSDGYINLTGKVLNGYYTGNDDFLKVINEKKPLSNVGITPKIVNYSKDGEALYFKKNEQGLPWYNKTNFIVGVSEYEYFKANSLEEIRSFQYLTYNEQDEIQGYVTSKGFMEYQGSDNNGYLYVQDRSGQWFVSYMEDNGEMSAFMLLEQVVEAGKVY